LVALTHLARGGDQLSSAREIADAYRIPLPILMNILKTLSRQGMVSSTRGARGGYRLSTKAADISLHMVIEALEGPVHLFPCSQHSGGNGTVCERQRWCPVTAPARKVSGKFQEFLEGVSLADIAGDEVSNLDPVAINL
jgi:Rrf2 family protein